MKALTVQQPWAWAVMSGRQNFFMEPFPPKLRGYFLIHAGIGYDFSFERWLREHSTVVPSSLPKAQLLGYARLINITTRRLGGPQPDFPGSPFVFTVSEVSRLKFPHVAAGRRGFWPVPRRMLEVINLPEHVTNNPL